MAGWDTVQLNTSGLSVSASSAAKWRRWILRHIAYFVGQRPQFRLVFAAEKSVAELSIWWRVTSPGYNGLVQRINVQALGSGETFSTVIRVPMLPYSGEYAVEVSESNDQVERPVYTFVGVTFESLALRLIIPLVAGVLVFAIARIV